MLAERAGREDLARGQDVQHHVSVGGGQALIRADLGQQLAVERVDENPAAARGDPKLPPVPADVVQISVGERNLPAPGRWWK